MNRGYGYRAWQTNFNRHVNKGEKANLERVEQNENRQQTVSKTVSRAKRRKKFNVNFIVNMGVFLYN